MQRWIGWILLGLLGVAAISGLAGHAPPRLRLLLLFPLAFGLLVGGASGCLARQFELRRPVLAALVTSILAIAGLANVAWIACGELAARARRAVQEDPQRLLALRVLESADMTDPRNLRHYRELRAALEPTFRDYLASRLAGAFGWPPAPWPELAWGGEILIAAVAAAWMTWRQISGVKPVSQTLQSASAEAD